MAKQVIHQLIDDIDGTVLEPGRGVSVSFSLEGKSYEIDLTEANAEKLKAALEPYVAAGRRVMSTVGATRRPTRKPVSGGRDLTAVREWARAQGHTVSDRGRVPDAILQAYDAAH
ncbi:histone-like nucleoid-structuring protein Lsr2 [Microbacterium amylolyticum]|uniref:Lsr2 family protein n=1 Tax=Microbacterium amylolyticum TaxID=936337 RepID=A0ABS4ZIZ4_9MICO|nr:Lsr2 family protein [Microbacterium amylolyticum]MBP2437241.1 hypothetical protein [Microbacterium amylolyticum]